MGLYRTVPQTQVCLGCETLTRTGPCESFLATTCVARRAFTPASAAGRAMSYPTGGRPLPSWWPWCPVVGSSYPACPRTGESTVPSLTGGETKADCSDCDPRVLPTALARTCREPAGRLLPVEDIAAPVVPSTQSQRAAPNPGIFAKPRAFPASTLLWGHIPAVCNTGSIHGVARARAGVLITAQIAALGVRAASYSPRVRICPAGSGVPTPCPSCGTFNEPAEPLGRDTVHAAQPRNALCPGV